MNKNLKLLPMLVVLAALIASLVPPAQAAVPPGPYFNGFEQNTNGWFGVSGSTITRTPSGASSTYASGIQSSSGNWHARLGMGSNLTCMSGAGLQDYFPGPRTNWGGYSSTFPEGGYKTAVDIYLDTTWAQTNRADRRFDWSSAINKPDGTHRRDFAFNAGTLGGTFVVSASFNANRCGAYPENPGRDPYVIAQSGWYTFTHTFTGQQNGPLTVTLTITQKSSGLVLKMWVLSDTSDIIGVTVGGNRYGWFVQNEIDQLAIDNSLRTGLCRSGGGEGDVEDSGSGKHGHARFNGNGCEGGSQGGNVEENDQNSNDSFRSTTVTSANFTAAEDSQTMTMVGTGIHNGVPVAFTMVAVDNGTVAPATFGLILSDGYAIAGPVVTGSISIP
jgi:hypothetical protein